MRQTNERRMAYIDKEEEDETKSLYILLSWLSSLCIRIRIHMANNNRPLVFFLFSAKIANSVHSQCFPRCLCNLYHCGLIPTHIRTHTHQNMYHTHRPISIHLCILYTLLDIINKYCIHNKSACIYILLLLNGMAYLIYFFPMYMHFVSDACVIAQACNSYRIHRYI